MARVYPLKQGLGCGEVQPKDVRPKARVNQAHANQGLPYEGVRALEQCGWQVQGNKGKEEKGRGQGTKGMRGI